MWFFHSCSTLVYFSRGFSLIICTFWVYVFLTTQCKANKGTFAQYIIITITFYMHSILYICFSLSFVVVVGCVLKTLIFKWTFILYNSSVGNKMRDVLFVCVCLFVRRLNSRLFTFSCSLPRSFSSFTAVEPQAQQYGPKVYVISRKTETHFNGGTNE